MASIYSIALALSIGNPGAVPGEQATPVSGIDKGIGKLLK